MTKVAVVQTKVTSLEENFQRIINYLDEAIKHQADITVFPEFALQYYTALSDQPTFKMLLPFFKKDW